MAAHEAPGGKMQRYGLVRGDHYDGLTYEEARGLEQTLMVAYHTLNALRDSGNLNVNFINGVSKSKGNKDAYFDSAVDYYKKYPTYFENQIQNEISNIAEDMNLWWD